eukprot:COSAG06_NODE_12281_length_1400_cov_0.953882_1_plen_236_part_10
MTSPESESEATRGQPASHRACDNGSWLLLLPEPRTVGHRPSTETVTLAHVAPAHVVSFGAAYLPPNRFTVEPRPPPPHQSSTSPAMGLRRNTSWVGKSVRGQQPDESAPLRTNLPPLGLDATSSKRVVLDLGEKPRTSVLTAMTGYASPRRQMHAGSNSSPPRAMIISSRTNAHVNVATFLSGSVAPQRRHELQQRNISYPQFGPIIRSPRQGPGNAWKVSSIGSEQLRQEQIAAF